MDTMRICSSCRKPLPASAPDGLCPECLIRAGMGDDFQPLPAERETAPDAGDKPESLGTVIGRYKLLQRIGEGGFGVVYLAEQEEPIRRRVALKIIKLGMDTRQVIARFEAERQALAMMNHPNIAKVLDAGATGTGRPYFVMELVTGIPITDYCDKNKLGTRQRLALFVEVCKAMQHAHQKGIIHRDIKPSNVLVTLSDGRPVPKVIDFGIAKATQQRLTEKTLFTEFKQFVGTPQYMSPEQAEMSELDVDTRTDIYSLGVLLYELLTGTTPFEVKELGSAGFDEIRRIIAEEEPPKPSTRLSTLGEALDAVAKLRQSEPGQLRKTVRGELDWIVMKSLEKDRLRRYATAHDLAGDIEHYLCDEPVLAGPPGAGYRMRKFVRRNRALVTGLTAVLVTMLAGIVASTVLVIRAERARAEAARQARTSQAVSDFLRDDLLGSADPWAGRIEGTSVISFLNAASKRLEGKFADEPLIEASIRRTLGTTYLHLGHYEDAEKHLKSGLELYRRQLGNESLETLFCMRELGWTCQALEKTGQAEALLSEALRGLRRILQEEDPVLLYCMGWLSWVYIDQGRYAEAEKLESEALEVIRRKLGPEHPWAPSFIYSIGVIYGEQGRFDEAEQLVKEALDLSRRTRGNRGVETLNILFKLGDLYLDQSRFMDAEPLLLEVLAGRREVLGDEHPDSLLTMDTLGWLHCRQGSLGEAERLLGECYRRSLEALGMKLLETMRRVLGEENPHTLGLKHMIGLCYLTLGRGAEAEALLIQALEGRRRVLGENHPDTLATLGVLHFTEARYDEAEPLLANGLANGRQTEDENADVFNLDNTLHCLALAHLKQLHYDKAEPLLLQLLDSRRRRLIEGHAATRAAVNALIDLYAAWGKPEKAEEYRAELLREQSFTPALPRG